MKYSFLIVLILAIIGGCLYYSFQEHMRRIHTSELQTK